MATEAFGKYIKTVARLFSLLPNLTCVTSDCSEISLPVSELLLSYRIIFDTVFSCLNMHRHTSSRSLSAVVRGRRSLAGYPPSIRLLSVGRFTLRQD